MTDQERNEETSDAKSGAVVHGGEGDPLGGGVAELKDSDEVSEGEPEQDASQVDGT